MSKNFLEKIAELLSNNTTAEYKYIPNPNLPLPNVESIKEFMNLANSIIFNGYFKCKITAENSATNSIERLYNVLAEQIYCGICFSNNQENTSNTNNTAGERANAFVNKLPEIKRLLATDVKAVYDCDPAATSFGEVIFCYPAIKAMLHYRIAHELLLLQIPLLPRIITELAHSETGIDIHPGATIGEYFSIDHGTGVVIGETCIIGNRVRLYQGVTLGARGFTIGNEGKPLNEPRHPVIEDNVIIYSNSTILGRITIGHDSVIGGNIWQVQSVPPHSRIIQRKATTAFTDGLGI
ncbi:MAG: serine acetyltransferase [Prevotellaceae bacterium]|jgi:serine O-acetyltransferase|nr:serine acetyltransferase [Prevotellaceae bacterium]